MDNRFANGMMTAATLAGLAENLLQNPNGMHPDNLAAAFGTIQDQQIRQQLEAAAKAQPFQTTSQTVSWPPKK